MEKPPSVLIPVIPVRLRAEDFATQPISNPLQALQGAIAGVQITQTNGLSGGKVTVSVQGPNSIINGNDPLYVIDGVPFISQMPVTTVAGNDQTIAAPLSRGSP